MITTSTIFKPWGNLQTLCKAPQIQTTPQVRLKIAPITMQWCSPGDCFATFPLPRSQRLWRTFTQTGSHDPFPHFWGGVSIADLRHKFTHYIWISKEQNIIFPHLLRKDCITSLTVVEAICFFMQHFKAYILYAIKTEKSHRLQLSKSNF